MTALLGTEIYAQQRPRGRSASKAIRNLKSNVPARYAKLKIHFHSPKRLKLKSMRISALEAGPPAKRSDIRNPKSLVLACLLTINHLRQKQTIRWNTQGARKAGLRIHAMP